MIDLQHSNKLLPQYSAKSTEQLPPKPKEKKLSTRRRKFCDEYLIDFNGSRAYRVAYNVQNEDTAKSNASKLLTLANVRAYLGARIDELSQSLRIRQEKTLRELRNVGYSNMLDYVKWGKNGVELKESSELTRDQGAAISQITETITQRGGSKTIKLHDKVEALTRLGQNLKLFEEDKLKDVNIAVQVVNVR